MEQEEILQLRNALFNTRTSALLLKYIQDHITLEGSKPGKSGECVKGMCEIAQLIKNIPSKCK